jgi:hypothetical protein
MDFTAVIRDKNVASGNTTNFGAIPFNNMVNGGLREYQFSSQNSRLGLRLDARVREAKVLGYLETDFAFEHNLLLPHGILCSHSCDKILRT